MCATPKIKTNTSDVQSEVIKAATQADASTQKASVATRTSNGGIVSGNIKTANIGIDDEVITSKKKLLGE